MTTAKKKSPTRRAAARPVIPPDIAQRLLDGQEAILAKLRDCIAACTPRTERLDPPAPSSPPDEERRS